MSDAPHIPIAEHRYRSEIMFKYLKEGDTIEIISSVCGRYQANNETCLASLIDIIIKDDKRLFKCRGCKFIHYLESYNIGYLFRIVDGTFVTV
jgi:hypothetical protein